MQLENLNIYKDRIMQYYEEGQFDIDNAKIIDNAKKHIENNLGKPNLTVIFDIDDTAIDLYNYWKSIDFGCTVDAIKQSYLKIELPHNDEVYKLYKYCINENLNIIFLSGRKKTETMAINGIVQTINIEFLTTQLLSNAGYSKYIHLIMKNQDDDRSDEEFKAEVIKLLQNSGLYICVNVGDQYTDHQNTAEYQCECINKMYDIRYY